MSFLEDLEAAKATDAPTEDVTVLLNGNPHTLTFTRMSGIDWAHLVDKHPPRLGITPDGGPLPVKDDAPVMVDAKYGYNVRGVVLEAAPLSGVVDGEAHPADVWEQMLETLDGAAIQRITDAIWKLNEYGPEQEVDAARKARPTSRKSSKSRSSSA